MKLIGVTVDYALIDVVLAECPSFVADNIIAHIARSYSPLIIGDSVVCYDEEHDVCEGDFVYSGTKFIGIVYYSAGWRVHEHGKTDKKLSCYEHIYMKRSKRNYDVFGAVNKMDGRKPIKICALGEEFNFNTMIMIRNGDIVLSGSQKHVPCDELFISTGFHSDDNVPLRFGGYYEGGIVCIDDDFDLAIKLYDGQTSKLNLEEN